MDFAALRKLHLALFFSYTVDNTEAILALEYWLIPIGVTALLFILLILICFFKIFFAVRIPSKEEYPIPEGKAYECHRPKITQWIKDIRAMEQRDVEITSHDGLRLTGKYYEYKKGAPIEILFHGYKGSAERDLCGGVHRCFGIGHNALIVDHRASGSSDGRVITFGIKESRDCLGWIDFVIKEIDSEAKIILTGISMGAATVMIASGMDLPENVVGILADCGYTSAKDIIKKVMRDMHLPAGLLYPFARLAARLLGGFDPDSLSPIDAMKRCRLPIIFFHGDADSFVPCSMSKKNYEACASEHKRLVIIPDADHGLCFPVAQDRYLSELCDFFGPHGF